MSNAASPRDVKKAKQNERFTRRAELADLREVLSLPGGRRHVWRLLTQAGVFRQSFVQGAADCTVFNEGRRSMGLSLMADVMAVNPEIYVKMAQEANQAQGQEQKQHESQDVTEEDKVDE